ncbi:hypothetical protein CERZMDRAFT_90738 [Cercospora zeae-maydis SCOH1-5]|uniref:Uncharacterized protein n=1 Tax=Cercospora zeae-maydis SCOH1-5 TaxID=717836 RepID=A0A6A6FGF9_9PEZI|nr:hypothetical protein CERZMDRAFT_90738 [Cercospora zeae-maydis SCOH1-5]
MSGTVYTGWSYERSDDGNLVEAIRFVMDMHHEQVQNRHRDLWGFPASREAVSVIPSQLPLSCSVV